MSDNSHKTIAEWEEPTCNFGALKENLGISKSLLSLHRKELRHASLVEKLKMAVRRPFRSILID